MNRLAAEVHAAVAAVCPIDGVSLVDENDPRTWFIDFKGETTAEQKTAALSIMDGWKI